MFKCAGKGKKRVCKRSKSVKATKPKSKSRSKSRSKSKSKSRSRSRSRSRSKSKSRSRSNEAKVDDFISAPPTNALQEGFRRQRLLKQMGLPITQDPGRSQLVRDSRDRKAERKRQLDVLFDMRGPSGILNRLTPDETMQEARERRTNMMALQNLEERQNRFIAEYPSYENRRDPYASQGGGCAACIFR